MPAPQDRVQLLKQESTALGGDDADVVEWGATPLDPLEDAPEVRGIFYQPSGGPKDELVYTTRDAFGNLVFKDANNVEKTLSDLTGGSGITEGQHEGLDTLVHEIDETSFDEVTYTGNDITNYIVWTSPAKVLKIREELYTYDTGHRVTQLITIQYDASGVEKMRTTEVYTYTIANRVASITRTKVP